MGMDFKARDLIAAGWTEGRNLGAAVKRARELQATGLDLPGVLAALEVDYPKQARRVELRAAPAAFAEAVEAETPSETASVAASRARMTELLHVPVVKRGALMPDTCPAGAGVATIPVGGAIEVENAILPGAHSADICCSMFASLFPDNHPIGELMDQLWASTHFGAGGRVGNKSRRPSWRSPSGPIRFSTGCRAVRVSSSARRVMATTSLTSAASRSPPNSIVRSRGLDMSSWRARSNAGREHSTSWSRIMARAHWARISTNAG